MLAEYNSHVHRKESLKGQIIESLNRPYSEGPDKPDIRNWKWPPAPPPASEAHCR